MQNALNEYGIHCAFLWPNWAETYSYIFYELAINDIYIITNEVSGNISYEVKSKHNGIVFENFSKCLEYITDVNNVKNDINQYRTKGSFHICNLKMNTDISNLVINNGKVYENKKSKKIYKNLLASLLYCAKYKLKIEKFIK